MSKLKKYALLGVFLLPIILFSACLPGQKSETQTQKQAENEMKEMARIMESGGSGYCELTDEKGNKLEYWFKNKKMKTKGMGFGQTIEDDEMQIGYMINDSEWMYTWAENQVEGVKIKMPTEEELKDMEQNAKEMAEKFPDFSSEDTADAYEEMGYKINCKKKNVSDSEFIPPSNIKFQNMSEMMEASMQMGEKMMTDFDQADLEEMQKMAEEMEKKFGQ
ncbi:MAG: hypothetical protein ABFQ62_04405 [Patescibacteria group bacterium]